jgi:hypothetical protein
LNTELLKLIFELERYYGALDLNNFSYSQHASSEGSQTEPHTLTQNLPSCQGRSPTEPHDARIRAVALRVHPKGEASAADNSANQDKIQPPRAIRETVQDISQDQAEACKV